MTIALFGASGKIGRHLVPRLLAQGHDLRVLIHRTPLDGDAARIAQIPGSVTDAAAVDTVVADADIVIQMATTKEDPATFSTWRSRASSTS